MLDTGAVPHWFMSRDGERGINREDDDDEGPGPPNVGGLLETNEARGEVIVLFIGDRSRKRGPGSGAGVGTGEGMCADMRGGTGDDAVAGAAGCNMLVVIVGALVDADMPLDCVVRTKEVDVGFKPLGSGGPSSRALIPFEEEVKPGKGSLSTSIIIRVSFTAVATSSSLISPSSFSPSSPSVDPSASANPSSDP